MYRINTFFFTVIQSLILIDGIKQSNVKQAVMAFKAIGKTIKNPVISRICNTIIKPMGMLRRQKNIIKNFNYGFEKGGKKIMKIGHNFGARSVKYLGEQGIQKHKLSAVVKDSINLIRKDSKKTFQKTPAAQMNRKQFRPIAKRSTEQQRGNELRSLINMAFKNKSFMPLLFSTSLGTMMLAQPATVYSDNDLADNDNFKTIFDPVNIVKDNFDPKNIEIIKNQRHPNIFEETNGEKFFLAKTLYKPGVNIIETPKNLLFSETLALYLSENIEQDHLYIDMNKTVNIAKIFDRNPDFWAYFLHELILHRTKMGETDKNFTYVFENFSQNVENLKDKEGDKVFTVTRITDFVNQLSTRLPEVTILVVLKDLDASKAFLSHNKGCTGYSKKLIQLKSKPFANINQEKQSVPSVDTLNIPETKLESLKVKDEKSVKINTHPEKLVSGTNAMNYEGKIEVFFGPMFSGKTSELIRRVNKHRANKQEVLVVNYSKDSRYSDKDVCATHDRIMLNAHKVNKLNQIDDMVENYDVIAVDEAQFFDDLVHYAEKWANIGKTVIVAALDATFQMKPFGKISELLPQAENVQKLHAICLDCGNTASFTRRTTKARKIKQIGNEDIYKPVCRKCFFKDR